MKEAAPEKVLIVSVTNLREHQNTLTQAGFAVDWVETIGEARRRIESNEPAIVIVPAALAHQEQFCKDTSVAFPSIEIVLVAQASEPGDTVNLMDEADVDYMEETSNGSLLLARLRRALRHRARRRELFRLRREITRDQGYESMLGISEQMRTVFELIDKAASTNASVLITGESGTGKELVAQALHQCSVRSKEAFVAINCSAVPEPLLESELFGHVKGAFTGARDSRPGLFAKASGGTLFLDEIGDMPLPLQPKLLRALQERTIRPVGGDQEISIDVRIVAATNQDLEQAIEKHLFREDLFYRLNVIHIEVPPLRERPTDILLLAESLAMSSAKDMGKDIRGISRPAAARLLRYGWPGNVRELQNCMERATALCEEEMVCVADLPDTLRAQVQVEPWPANDKELVPLDVIERRYIEHVLKAFKGNKKAAARVLGLDRKTLYRKIDKYRVLAVKEDERDPTATRPDLR